MCYRKLGMFAAYHDFDLEDLEQICAAAVAASWPRYKPRSMGGAHWSTWVGRICFYKLIELERSLERRAKRDALGKVALELRPDKPAVEAVEGAEAIEQLALRLRRVYEVARDNGLGAGIRVGRRGRHWFRPWQALAVGALCVHLRISCRRASELFRTSELLRKSCSFRRRPSYRWIARAMKFVTALPLDDLRRLLPQPE
jgi:hypothetical protein